MSDALQVIIFGSIVGGVWLYSCIRDTIRAWRFSFIYSVKTIIKYCQMIVGFVFAMYTMVIGAFILKPFMDLWDTIYKPFVTNPQSDFIYNTAPMFIIILIIVIALALLFFIGFKPLLALTVKEKVYETSQKEQRKKRFDERIKRYPHMIQWFLKN